MRKLHRAAAPAATSRERVERGSFSKRDAVRRTLVSFCAHAEIHVQELTMRQVTHVTRFFTAGRNGSSEIFGLGTHAGFRPQ